MDLKSIMTFDKRILKLDGMSMDEQVFADGAFRSGWILGIDESDQLMYFEPTSGETHSVTLDGDRIMRSTTDSGSGVVGAAQAAPAAQPAAPLPTLAAISPAAAPAAPVPAAPVPAAPVPAPPVPAPPAPAAPAGTIPPPGPTQIAAGIWQMPANAVQIAPGIFQIQ